ncbi:MAG: succinate dehydrogenase assembly factor 2 [Alphaproteobacteria bacterium]|nr:succinate dehydrogenase assembly factor 2 [Alphaproteobacteria bacterium]
MENDIRLRRIHFRAWHRGTREADMMIGGFFDRYGTEWSEPDLQWFERLLDEDDVDVMAWAIGMQPVPAEYAGPLMDAMKKLDFIEIFE